VKQQHQQHQQQHQQQQLREVGAIQVSNKPIGRSVSQ
jgi:hypothetical protein